MPSGFECSVESCRLNITTVAALSDSCYFFMDRHPLLQHFHYIILLASLAYIFTALHTIQYTMQDHDDNNTQGGGGMWKMYQHSLFFFQAPPPSPTYQIGYVFHEDFFKNIFRARVCILVICFSRLLILCYTGRQFHTPPQRLFVIPGLQLLNNCGVNTLQRRINIVNWVDTVKIASMSVNDKNLVFRLTIMDLFRSRHVNEGQINWL